MLTSSEFFLIQRLFKNIFFTASMFLPVVNVLGSPGQHCHWHLVGLPETNYTPMELVFFFTVNSPNFTNNISNVLANIILFFT